MALLVRLQRLYNGNRSIMLLLAFLTALCLVGYTMRARTNAAASLSSPPEDTKSLHGANGGFVPAEDLHAPAPKSGGKAGANAGGAKAPKPAQQRQDPRQKVLEMVKRAKKGGSALAAPAAPAIPANARPVEEDANGEPLDHIAETPDFEVNVDVQPSTHEAYSPPLQLTLDLPESILNDPVLKDQTRCIRQYGFDLDASNRVPLHRTLPDFRNDKCKAITYPPDLPKASVIIIYYNEPMSSLLRNVMSVINRTPPNLLGEIIMVDDHSTLAELKYLPRHLARLPKGLVKHVRRTLHNGIVGARVRGAAEATHPIIVFLDSHSEVTPGWIEPLLMRIKESPKTAVVPSLGSISTRSLEMMAHGGGAMMKGSFNWRLTFTIVGADQSDLVPGHGDHMTAPIRSPVMPGGLFAMDRRWFFESGAYDPEILYYGGEHVELSFRVWMCGGTVESIPCSNVGHIYRDFDRFAVDTQIQNLSMSVFSIMDRNDMRVAEVWMDEYKTLFYNSRGLHGRDFGDVSARRAIREKLQCHSFQWFLDNVHPDKFVPDIHPPFHGVLADPNKQNCLDNMQNNRGGPVGLYGCHGLATQRWAFGKNGYLMHDDMCLDAHASVVATPCEKAPDWVVGTGDDTVLRLADSGACIHNSGGAMAFRSGAACDSNDAFTFKDGVIATKDKRACLGRHPQGNYIQSQPCGENHAHGEWMLSGGKLHHSAVQQCLNGQVHVQQRSCGRDEPQLVWEMHDGQLWPHSAAGFCLDRENPGETMMAACKKGKESQQWKFFERMK